MKILFRVLLGLVVLAVILLIAPFVEVNIKRTREFRAKAKEGQLIVRAIEQYKAQKGEYPPSLAVLAPAYLPEALAISQWRTHNARGWDYEMVTNDSQVTYRLRYYIGRGGVEYEPPVWFANDDGHRRTLFKND